MVIQQLKPSARVPGRWLAWLEDGSLLRVGEAEVLAFDLYVGRTLTDGEAEALMASVARTERRQRALELAAGKPLSRRELERKLGGWGADEEEQAAVCGRLEELGYLNDGAYAAQVVRHYAARGYGVRKLRDELYRRGIPRELWDAALEEQGDTAGAIDAFLEKKLKGRAPEAGELKKLSDALARRGFGWEEIRDALGRYGAADWEA